MLLNKARKEMERVKTQAAADKEAAQLARQVARAAKVKLKHARKLSKMAKKSARRAEEKSEKSSQALESAQAKLEKLQKRIRKEQRNKKPARRVRRSKPVQKASLKPKPVLSSGSSQHSQPKPKPKKRTEVATPPVSHVQSQQTTKPAARRTHGSLGTRPKTVNGRPAKRDSPVAPESKPVPASVQKLGAPNPLSTPDGGAPSTPGEEPKTD